MFDKRDYRMYRGIGRDTIYRQVCDYWTSQGFLVAQLSPYQIQGVSQYSRIGMKREFYLRLDEVGGDTYVDLQFKAKVTDEGMIGGVAAAVIFFPVALIGGAISYSEYEDDAAKLVGTFWGFMDQLTLQVGTVASAPPPQYPPQTTEMSPCKGCGALIPCNWKACPYCGGAMG